MTQAADARAMSKRLDDPAGIEMPMVAYCWHAERL